MASLTGAQILTFVGVKTPTAEDTDWSDMVAEALLEGLTVRLNGALPPTPSRELDVALLLGGAEAYKRREAQFASAGYADLEGSAIKFARDYLDSIRPMIDRYSAGPGIA